MPINIPKVVHIGPIISTRKYQGGNNGVILSSRPHTTACFPTLHKHKETTKKNKNKNEQSEKGECVNVHDTSTIDQKNLYLVRVKKSNSSLHTALAYLTIFAGFEKYSVVDTAAAAAAAAAAVVGGGGINL